MPKSLHRQTRRHVLSALLCVTAGALQGWAFHAHAASYPQRPITVVVPWPAGGATDLAARTFATHLGAVLKTSMVVDNRPGATGIVGATAVANAPKDGYTLLLASAETHAINPVTYQSLSYDPRDDFVPVAAFAQNPYALVARADFPADDVTALVNLIRKEPGRYTYASASLGSASQIVMEMFKLKQKLETLHVPYQGEAPAVAAMMGGQIDMMILPVGRAMTLRQSGKLKVYAVTPNERFDGMADVPTFAELGMSDMQIANWFALMAPAGTPSEVITVLEQAIAQTSGDAATQEAIRKLGLVPLPPTSQAEFASFVDKESQRWKAEIEQAGIHAK